MSKHHNFNSGNQGWNNCPTMISKPFPSSHGPMGFQSRQNYHGNNSNRIPFSNSKHMASHKSNCNNHRTSNCFINNNNALPGGHIYGPNQYGSGPFTPYNGPYRNSSPNLMKHLFNCKSGSNPNYQPNFMPKHPQSRKSHSQNLPWIFDNLKLEEETLYSHMQPPNLAALVANAAAAVSYYQNSSQSVPINLKYLFQNVLSNSQNNMQTVTSSLNSPIEMMSHEQFSPSPSHYPTCSTPNRYTPTTFPNPNSGKTSTTPGNSVDISASDFSEDSDISSQIKTQNDDKNSKDDIDQPCHGYKTVNFNHKNNNAEENLISNHEHMLAKMNGIVGVNSGIYDEKVSTLGGPSCKNYKENIEAHTQCDLGNESMNETLCGESEPGNIFSEMCETASIIEGLLMSYHDINSAKIWQFYMENRQTEVMYHRKIQLRNALHIVMSKVIENAGLYVVGSSMNGFGTDKSDMDLCLTLSPKDMHQKKEAFSVLNQLVQPLRKCSFIRNLQLIRAKVPILKFRDTLAGVDCDLNINNTIGIYNTHLMAIYTRIDWRVRPLAMFAKHWAQCLDIHDASRGRLSTYTIVLLMIHYLQVGCNPPVLPCLQAKFPKAFSYERTLKEIDMRLELPWDELRSANTSSLSELFMGFMEYFGEQFDFSQFAVSIRHGQALPIDTAIKQLPAHEQLQAASSFKLFVEEPFSLHNVARSLFDDSIFSRIERAFCTSLRAMRMSRDLSSILSNPV